MLFIWHELCWGGLCFSPLHFAYQASFVVFLSLLFQVQAGFPRHSSFQVSGYYLGGILGAVSRHALLKQCVCSLLIMLRITFAFKCWNWADIYAISFLKQSFSLTLRCQTCCKGHKNSQINTSGFCPISSVTGERQKMVLHEPGFYCFMVTDNGNIYNL